MTPARSTNPKPVKDATALKRWFAALNDDHFVALPPPTRSRYTQSDGHDDIVEHCQQHGLESVSGVFWHWQSHERAFAKSGELVDDLLVHWVGEHGAVATKLADPPAPFEVRDGGPGQAFRVTKPFALPEPGDRRGGEATLRRLGRQVAERALTDEEAAWLRACAQPDALWLLVRAGRASGADVDAVWPDLNKVDQDLALAARVLHRIDDARLASLVAAHRDDTDLATRAVALCFDGPQGLAELDALVRDPANTRAVLEWWFEAASRQRGLQSAADEALTVLGENDQWLVWELIATQVTGEFSPWRQALVTAARRPDLSRRLRQGMVDHLSTLAPTTGEPELELASLPGDLHLNPLLHREVIDHSGGAPRQTPGDRDWIVWLSRLELHAAEPVGATRPWLLQAELDDATDAHGDLVAPVPVHQGDQDADALATELTNRLPARLAVRSEAGQLVIAPSSLPPVHQTLTLLAQHPCSGGDEEHCLSLWDPIGRALRGKVYRYQRGCELWEIWLSLGGVDLGDRRLLSPAEADALVDPQHAGFLPVAEHGEHRYWADMGRWRVPVVQEQAGVVVTEWPVVSESLGEWLAGFVNQ